MQEDLEGAPAMIHIMRKEEPNGEASVQNKDTVSPELALIQTEVCFYFAVI